VQRGVEKNLFTREAALKAYGVSRWEYEEFLGKNMTKQLQLSVSADLTITIQDYGTIVHVMAKMFQALATLPHVGRLQHLDSAMREMGKLSREVEHDNFHLDE